MLPQLCYVKESFVWKPGHYPQTAASENSYKHWKSKEFHFHKSNGQILVVSDDVVSVHGIICPLSSGDCWSASTGQDLSRKRSQLWRDHKKEKKKQDSSHGNSEKPRHCMECLTSCVPNKDDSKDLLMNSVNPINETVSQDVELVVSCRTDVQCSQYSTCNQSECLVLKCFCRSHSCSLGLMTVHYGSQGTHVYMNSHIYVHLFKAGYVCIGGRMK